MLLGVGITSLSFFKANIEDKFQALHEKEKEIQELRRELRERDRLVENINAAVLQLEDTVKVRASLVFKRMR